MDFTFIKRYLPRSLFGRALLILLMPVVLLQLVVGAVFISRHFEGVTKQLTRGVANDLVYVLQNLQSDPSRIETIGQPFDLVLNWSDKTALTPGLKRRFYDISGRHLSDTLREAIDLPMIVDLVENTRFVTLEIDTGARILEVRTLRKNVAASNPHQLLVLMAGASLILVLVAVQFLRNQVKPIRRLAQAAEAFGKGRSEPFRPSGAEEVRRAGHAFLAMRGRIERHVDQRTQMLSGVSHDLRTPLTRLKLGLAMLDTDPEDTQLLERDLDEMEGMLDAFLDFARGDQGEDMVEIDPNALVTRLIADMQRSGTGKSFHPVIKDAPHLTCREMALTRALQNILNNAARYGNKVQLSVQGAAGSVEFIIEDDGSGIPSHQREAALRPFSRLDEARNQDKGGSVGLGLSIALDVARSHGGQLLLDESGAFGGLKVSLRLPR